MLFGPSMSTVYGGDYYGDADVNVGANSKSNAKADANSKQDTRVSIDTGKDTDSDSSTRVIGFMPSITVGSDAGSLSSFFYSHNKRAIRHSCGVLCS